jgi:hypothetical protein
MTYMANMARGRAAPSSLAPLLDADLVGDVPIEMRTLAGQRPLRQAESARRCGSIGRLTYLVRIPTLTMVADERGRSWRPFYVVVSVDRRTRQMHLPERTRVGVPPPQRPSDLCASAVAENASD